jgi:hypothetical protein
VAAGSACGGNTPASERCHYPSGGSRNLLPDFLAARHIAMLHGSGALLLMQIAWHDLYQPLERSYRLPWSQTPCGLRLRSFHSTPIGGHYSKPIDNSICLAMSGAHGKPPLSIATERSGMQTLMSNATRPTPRTAVSCGYAASTNWRRAIRPGVYRQLDKFGLDFGDLYPVAVMSSGYVSARCIG